MECFKLFLAILMLIRSAEPKTFRLQKGSYSNNNLCRNGIPAYERYARSHIECSMFCNHLYGNKCMSFKYEKDKKTCSLYQNYLAYDFIETDDAKCKGFQTMPDCPNGFKYLFEGNKCIQMKIGAWDWLTARTQCQNWHQRCHPVIVDYPCDAKLYFQFFNKEVRPKCNTSLTPKYSYWTAGISYNFNRMRQPFKWDLFQGVSREIKLTAPWKKGKPNSFSGDDATCIQLMHEIGLEDYPCDAGRCVLCEIDML